MRINGAEHGGEDRAGEPGECGAQTVGEELYPDEVDAERLGDVLIVADRHPGAPESRFLEPPGEVSGHE